MSSFPIIDAEARYLPIPDELEARFSPAALALFEWRDYFFQFPNARSIRVMEKDISPIAPGLFRVRWENALGLCEIQPPEEAPFWVEILSPKFPTLEAHFQFLSVLLNDLFARSRHLIWHFGGDTKRAFERSHQPPTPLETLDFLLRFGDRLELLLSRLLRNPPVDYSIERETVLTHQASRLDGQAVAELAQNPACWEQTRKQGRFGHAFPKQISQSRRVENFDSVEILLASGLCSQINKGLGGALLSRYFPVLSPEKQTRIKRLQNSLRLLWAAFRLEMSPFVVARFARLWRVIYRS